MTGSATQVLSFSAVYRLDVLAGRKISTVRWGEDLSIGPVSIVFDDDPSAALPARILTITSHRSDAISPTDVGASAETACAISSSNSAQTITRRCLRLRR